MLASSGDVLIGLAALVSAFGAAVASVIAAFRSGKAQRTTEGTQAMVGTMHQEVTEKVTKVEAKVDQATQAATAIAEHLSESSAKSAEVGEALLAYLKREAAK